MDNFQFNKLCTLELIKNDCDTYLALFKSNRDAVLSMNILPYLALMCVETQNFLAVQFIDQPYNDIFSNMRNSLKRFMERYGKTVNAIVDIDDVQNRYYSNKLRFKALAKMNIHLNLGVYLDESLNIIGNTQHLASIFDFEKIPGENNAQKSFNIGRQLGSVIKIISNSLEMISKSPVELKDEVHPVYYFDINTNNINDSFWNNNYSKEIRLYLLHLISSIGFINNMLARTLQKDNIWLLRLRYITCYYCICGLNRLSTHLEKSIAEELKVMIEKFAFLLNSRFRGCMMHYSLVDKKGFCIDPKCFDMNIPLYGLIESCFNGMAFQEYEQCLTMLSENIENLLKKQFKIKAERVKKIE